MTEPQIVRQNTPHQVTVNEGSRVATTKSLDPNGPNVRKTLAREQPPDEVVAPPAPAIPPPVAAKPPTPSGEVFERSVPQAPEDRLAAPEALAPQAEADPALVFERAVTQDSATAAPEAPPTSASGQGPVVERALHDARVQAPPAMPHEESPAGPLAARSLEDRFLTAAPGEGPADAADGPLIDRSLQDRFVAVPDGQAPADADPGPVVERGMADRFVAVPAGQAPADAEPGPVLDRSLQDRFVPVPVGEAPAEPPAQGPATGQSLQDRFVSAEDAAPLENLQAVPQASLEENLQAVQAPPAPAENLQAAPQPGQAEPNIQFLPEAQGPAAVAQPLPPEVASADQAPPPGPAQARGHTVLGDGAEPSAAPDQPALIEADALRAQQAPVEESLGAADHTWVEMDFPARVVKLKMENDKVRHKLDQLEAMMR